MVDRIRWPCRTYPRWWRCSWYAGCGRPRHRGCAPPFGPAWSTPDRPGGGARRGPLLDGGELWAPTAFASTGAGSRQAVTGALGDQVALELGDGAEDLERQLAAGRARIDPLIEHAQVHPMLSETGRQIDQVAHAVAKSVQFRDDQDVARAHEVSSSGAGGELALAWSVNTRRQPAAFGASS